MLNWEGGSRRKGFTIVLTLQILNSRVVKTVL